MRIKANWSIYIYITDHIYYIYTCIYEYWIVYSINQLEDCNQLHDLHSTSSQDSARSHSTAGRSPSSLTWCYPVPLCPTETHFMETHCYLFLCSSLSIILLRFRLYTRIRTFSHARQTDGQSLTDAPHSHRQTKPYTQTNKPHTDTHKRANTRPI